MRLLPAVECHDLDQIAAAVAHAAKTHDLILLNAGSSAGSEDYSARVVERLGTELTRTLKLPDVQGRIKGLGGEPGVITGEAFAAMNTQEFDHYGQLVRDANIKAE